MRTSPLLSVIVLAAGTLLAQAETSPAALAENPGSPVSVTLAPAFASQYMFRGARLSGPAFEPTLAATYGQATLGVWANFPLWSKVPGQSDPEIDPYGSYTITLCDNLNLAPGFTLYTYPRAEPANGFYRLTFEPNLALNYTVGSLTLTPKVYYDVVLRGPTCELNATCVVPLKTLGTELDFTGTLGTFRLADAVAQAAPAAKNWGDYWLVGVSLPFAIGKNSKLTLGWALTAGRNNYYKQGPAPRAANPLAVTRGVLTVGYSWTL